MRATAVARPARKCYLSGMRRAAGRPGVAILLSLLVAAAAVAADVRRSLDRSFGGRGIVHIYKCAGLLELSRIGQSM